MKRASSYCCIFIVCQEKVRRLPNSFVRNGNEREREYVYCIYLYCACCCLLEVLPVLLVVLAICLALSFHCDTNAPALAPALAPAHAHTHTRARAHAHTHTHTHTHTHARTHAHTHSHARTHIHTHASLLLVQSLFSVVFLPRQAVGLGAPQTIIRHPLTWPTQKIGTRSVLLANFQSSRLCRLHVFSFHTAILACVVDNIFIIFLTDLRGCSGFHFPKLLFYVLFFSFTIWWSNDPMVENLHLAIDHAAPSMSKYSAGVNSDLGNGFFGSKSVTLSM